MRLKFLQGGGSFNPRYSVYEPHVVPEEELSETTSSKGSKTKTIDSDILKMIKESFSNGLPSDLQAASTTIANVFSNIERMLNEPDMYGTGSIANAYARALPLLKSIEFNSREYEAIYKSLNENGSMQEVAINSSGQLAVQTEEGFSWITPEEYHANREQYYPITNSQLLDARANSPSLAFQNNVFETLKNGVSSDAITKQILEYASKVGSTEQIQTGYGYVSGGTIMRDFKTFSKEARLQGFNPKEDDLYSYELVTKSERENAYIMLDIIYNMLPTTSRALLKYKSNGTDSGAKGMIAILMGAATDHSFKPKITLEGGYSKGGGSNSSGDDKYFNHVFRAAIGEGYKEEFIINPGTNNFLKVQGTTTPIMNSNDEIMQTQVLSDVPKSTMGQILDTTQISVAGQHIDSSVINKIYLSVNQGTFVQLPWTYEKDDKGNYTNHIIPDYELLHQKDKVEEHMKNNNLTFKDNFEEIQEFIKLNKFNIKYNRQGEVQFPNVKHFVLFNVNVPEDVFPGKKIKNGKYVQLIKDKEVVKATYDILMTANNWTTKDWDFKAEGLWADEMYKSIVAIPVKISYLNMLTKDVDSETVLELSGRDQERRARENFNYDNRQLGQ